MPATLVASYTTVQRVYDTFPPISSLTGLSSAMVLDWIGGVEAEINAKISKRYALPLSGDCPILTAIATREAIYRIAVERALVQFPPAQQGKAPRQVQHEQDQKLLDQLAAGEITLYAVDSAGAFSALVAEETTQMEVYST